MNPLTGTIKLNTDREPWEMEHSCSLDAADSGEMILDEVAKRMGLTRERIRQVEARSLTKLKMQGEP